MKKHLTAADRKVIEILLQSDFTVTSIAKKIGKSVPTISREINNRGTPNGYFADIAQLDYETKRKRSSQNAKKVMHSKVRNLIIYCIKVGWSPEQVAGWMARYNVEARVCMETIYNMIYTDEYCVEERIFQYLPRGKKKRTKWRGRGTKKSKIPNRTSISKRPKIVKKREEVGHWEGDSVIYPNLKAINTVNELKTGYVVFTKLERRKADLTSEAMSSVLKGHISKTLTLDNGSEFVRHEEVAKEAKVETYFCHPYSSWERGANENVNGLLRRYLPKRKNIDKLTQEELNDIAYELNHRPRKRLGYMTPAEAYQREINNLFQNVAVRSRM
jgi:IS30 family transposase